MTSEEILLRRLAAQHLNSPAPPLTAVRNTCGLQAQYLSHSLHALFLRSGCKNTEGMVKTWTNRGTMHLIAESDLPLFLHRGRTHFLRKVDTMESDGIVSESRKQYFAHLILEEVENSIVSREGLKELCRRKGMTSQEESSLFDPWGGLIRALCESGKLCHQVSEEKAYRPCPPFEPMETNSARLELARRYFTHFGPATVRDAAGFFGFTQAVIKKCLRELPVEETEFRGITYYFIPDATPVSRTLPDCLFLAGFDQFLLGYSKKESLILPPEDVRSIFTLSGIVRPAILMHGQIVGYWNLKKHNLSVTCFRPCDNTVIRSATEELWPELGSLSFL